MTDAPEAPSISLNSARFLTSAARLRDCPPDTGAEVVFAGRSNAGKSSALNALTNIGKLARTSKTPGRTRLINFFSLNRPHARLVDLPGYGYAKVTRAQQAEWQQHLDDYLKRRQSLRGMVLLMDIRHPLTEFDRIMVDWCQHRNLPIMILLTKADKLKFGPAKQEMLKVRKNLREVTVLERILLFSALKGTGLEEAREQLMRWLAEDQSEPPLTNA